MGFAFFLLSFVIFIFLGGGGCFWLNGWMVEWMEGGGSFVRYSIKFDASIE